MSAFGGKSGHDVLVLRISAFDPKLTSLHFDLRRAFELAGLASYFARCLATASHDDSLS